MPLDTGLLQCKEGDAPDCATAPQVDFLRQLDAGPVNPRTGESIFPGMPSEVNCSGRPTRLVPSRLALLWTFTGAPSTRSELGLEDPGLRHRHHEGGQGGGPDPDADPNLNRFLIDGGKLMMYVGAGE